MKLVVLENDGVLPNEVKRIINKLNADVRVYTNFSNLNDKKEFFNSLIWCDTILTQTTLINKWQVDEMVKLMSNLPSKQILFNWENTPNDLFNYLENETDITLIDHHNIGYYNYDDDKIINSDKFKINADIIRLELAIKAEAKRVKAEAEKNYRDEAINRKTGQKIKVKRCLGCGSAFKTIIPNEIMDVLDMSEQDNQPNRGLWVWGNGEPVKLLNDVGYDEYEIVNPNINDLSIDILKRYDMDFNNKTEIFTIIGLVEDAKSNKNPTMALHDNITDWLDSKGIERRVNRKIIEKMLSSQLN
jgi:hypothetical protein